MTTFGTIPEEPPVVASIDVLAPKFRAKVEIVLNGLRARGWTAACIKESQRTNERAQWLYGFGRDYDDDRGIVTKAEDGFTTWHFFCLAVDVGLKGRESCPPQFYQDVFDLANETGLTSGQDWNHNGIPDAQEPGKHFCDCPHLQWWIEGMHVTPSARARELYESGGVAAVWTAVDAA